MTKCAHKILALTLSANILVSPALSWADGAAIKGSIVSPSEAPRIMNLGRLNLSLSPALTGANPAQSPALKSVLPLAAAAPVPVVKVQAETRAVPAAERPALASLGAAAGELAAGRQAPQKVLAKTYDFFSLKADQVRTGGSASPDAPSGLQPYAKRVLAATAVTMALAAPVLAAGGQARDVPSFSGAAFLGMFGGWLAGAGRKGGPKRDGALTNGLLEDAKNLRQLIEDDHSELSPAAAALGISVLTGDYAQAKDSLDKIISGPVSAKAKSLALAMRGRLPEKDFPGAKELAQAWKEVSASAVFDPFQLQTRLSRLLDGVLRANAPQELKDLQIDVRQKASHLVRQKAQERKTKGPAVAQQDQEDCWLHSLYHLPSPVLEPLRAQVSYDSFLKTVKSIFPKKDFKKNGLNNEEFMQVLSLLGLTMKSHEVTEEGLVELLKTHGSVIGAVVWFTKDTSKLDPFQALPFFRQHAVAITGVVDTPEGRQFVVRDSLVPWLTRYSKEELDMLSVVALVIEPEAPGSPEKKTAQFLRKN